MGRLAAGPNAHPHTASLHTQRLTHTRGEGGSQLQGGVMEEYSEERAEDLRVYAEGCIGV